MWVPEHRRIASNKIADQLTKEGSQIKFTVVKPDLGIKKSAVREAINEWAVKQPLLNWNHVSRQSHSKRIMERPSQRLIAYFH